MSCADVKLRLKTEEFSLNCNVVTMWCPSEQLIVWKELQERDQFEAERGQLAVDYGNLKRKLAEALKKPRTKV